MERNDGMTAVDEMFVTHRYAQEVVDGLRTCCKMEYLACQRHLRDLERQGTEEFPYVFDETRADRIFDSVFLPASRYSCCRFNILTWVVFLAGCTWKQASADLQPRLTFVRAAM